MSNLGLYLSDSLLAFLFTSPGSITFQVGFLTFRWYGLLIASAVLIGVNLSQYLAKQRDIDPSLIQKLTIWLVVTAIREHNTFAMSIYTYDNLSCGF